MSTLVKVDTAEVVRGIARPGSCEWYAQRHGQGLGLVFDFRSLWSTTRSSPARHWSLCHVSPNLQTKHDGLLATNHTVVLLG